MTVEGRIVGYAFTELSDEGTPGYKVPNGYVEADRSPKQRARDWYIEGWQDIGSSLLTETVERELIERGLDGLVNDSSPSWGLYVQGSGVAFSGHFTLDEPHVIDGAQGSEHEAERVELVEITALIPTGTLPGNWLVTVTHGGSYTHEHSYDVEVEYQWPDDDASDSEIAISADELAEAVRDYLRGLSRTLRQVLEDEDVYQSSEEQIAESCEANGYLFSATGEPVHHLIGGELCEHGVAQPWYCGKCDAIKRAEKAEEEVTR